MVKCWSVLVTTLILVFEIIPCKSQEQNLLGQEDADEYGQGSNKLEDDDGKDSDIPFLVHIRYINLQPVASAKRFCTGSLISMNWVLTAAHCFEEFFNFVENENGDKEFSFSNYLEVIKDHFCDPQTCNYRRGTEIIVDPNTSGNQGEAELTRNVKRVIMTKKFVGGALIWQGYDIALLELEGEWKGNTPIRTIIAPACLPYKGFMAEKRMFGNKDLKIGTAGYGARQRPICFTDLQGKGDNFGVCEVSSECKYLAEGDFKNCTPSFTVSGKKYDRCIKDKPTPQPSQECDKMRLKYDQLSNMTVYILTGTGNDTKLQDICPAKYTAGGWCKTHTPDSLDAIKNQPQADMWGLCPVNGPCKAGQLDSTESPKPIVGLSILSEEYCDEELDLNLEVEQPSSDWFTNKDKFSQANVGRFCLGYNISNESKFKSVGIYLVEEDLMVEDASQIYDKLPQNIKYNIKGGPNCRGDSGGPAYTIEEKDEGHVIVGVFSFILWGICGGSKDPPYFMTVDHNLDFIRKYIPENGTCTSEKDLEKDQDQKCTTIGGAAPNKTCIFPFKFNGVVHHVCTWDRSELTDYKAWCSTAVDAMGNHIGGQGLWGHCGPMCIIPDCVDKLQHCNAWASHGHCTDVYEHFMTNYCKKSCNLCAGHINVATSTTTPTTKPTTGTTFF